MSALEKLIKGTNAYKTVLADKVNNRLSHAYLIISEDGENLKEILKIFARLIFCREKEQCGECKTCRTIQNETYADVLFYPKGDKGIVTEDVSNIIEESYLKPVSGDKKAFVLSNAETMNLTAQNKLLKTLEEPPQNVHIIMGAVSEYGLLSTVKSRVKKLDIPPFSEEALYSALKDELTDVEKLKSAVACSDGTVGKVKAIYGDENFSAYLDCAVDMICGMQSSKDVLDYSVKVAKMPSLDEFLSVTELILTDMLRAKINGERSVSNFPLYSRVKDAEGYTEGAIIYALDKITQAKKRIKANNNSAMIIERLLFSILEGKYKWLKL